MHCHFAFIPGLFLHFRVPESSASRQRMKKNKSGEAVSRRPAALIVLRKTMFNRPMKRLLGGLVFLFFQGSNSFSIV